MGIFCVFVSVHYPGKKHPLTKTFQLYFREVELCVDLYIFETAASYWILYQKVCYLQSRSNHIELNTVKNLIKILCIFRAVRYFACNELLTLIF